MLPTASIISQSHEFLLIHFSLISLHHSELLQQASLLHYTTGSNYHRKHADKISFPTTIRQFPPKKLNTYYLEKTQPPEMIEYKLEKGGISVFPCLESDTITESPFKAEVSWRNTYIWIKKIAVRVVWMVLYYKINLKKKKKKNHLTVPQPSLLVPSIETLGQATTVLQWAGNGWMVKLQYQNPSC